MPQHPDTWLVGPAGSCISLVAEETRIASLLQTSIIALANQQPLLDAVRRQLRRARGSQDAINQLIARQQTVGQWARDLIRDDFHPINAHGIIGLWVAIEVTVEDTAVLILTRDVHALPKVSSLGVRVPQTTPLSESDARRVYRRLESHTREGRSVIDGYSYMLSVLDVTCSVSHDVSTVLSELNYVRNCILHRGGRVDERAAVEAPALNLALGSPILVDSKRYKKYFNAVAEFAQALLAGVLRSRYMPVRDSSGRLLTVDQKTALTEAKPEARIQQLISRLDAAEDINAQDIVSQLEALPPGQLYFLGVRDVSRWVGDEARRVRDQLAVLKRRNDGIAGLMRELIALRERRRT
jgi:hypothetical protein